jgi:transcriptional regulator with GAF, ATPase, and Fis domain
MSPSLSNLDRQRGRLIGLGGVLIAALCVTLVIVSAAREGFDLARQWPTLAGLTGLVLLFVLYLQQKHRELAALEGQLRDLAVREATMHARFTELSFLFDVSTQLQLRLDLNGVLELAAQRLVPCLDAHQASIMLFNPETGMLEVKAVAGVDANLVEGGRVKPGEGVAGHVFTTGEVLNLTPDLMRARFPEHVKRGRTIVAALCVPMRFRAGTIGVVSVSRGHGEPFGELHARMLLAFSEHCAATVVKTQHHHQLLEKTKAA